MNARRPVPPLTPQPERRAGASVAPIGKRFARAATVARRHDPASTVASLSSSKDFS